MNLPIDMLALEEALARILAAVPQPPSETIELKDAHGRVLSEPIRSPLDLPPFDNSAMDGYAVRAADVAQARAESPVVLRVLGTVAAGQVFPGQVGPGDCVRLFTGSPLPAGADAVVMQEDTRSEASGPGSAGALAGESDGKPVQSPAGTPPPPGVLVLEAVKPWENTRFRGEDIKTGELLAQPGDALTAGRLSLLAAVGVQRVNVARQPRVGLLATGSELRETGQPLSPGQIYESNRIGLAALVERAGAIPKIFPLTPDDLSATQRDIEHALSECDALVTTGGVSVGDLDFVKTAFLQCGGKLEFWRVAIKPGRPFVFGRRGDKLLFGLPGNPVSALITFLLLVRPALLRWQGLTSLSLPARAATLAEPLSNPGGRRHFMRVKMGADGRVYSAGLQASHALNSLAAADGLVDVPPETVLPTGAQVQVLHWE